VCLLAIFAACGKSGTGNAGADGDSGKITLSLSTFLYVESAHRRAIDGLLEAYNKINQNVQIQVSGTGYADYWNTLTSEILANNETDIVQIYPENVAQYQALRLDGTFMELDDRIAASGLADKLVGQNTALYEGKNVALSNYSWGTTGIFYRKSMLAEKGINPASIKTQEDFRNACLRFVDGNNTAMGVVYSSHGFVVSEWSRLIARPVSNGLFFKDGETGPYTPNRVNINSPENVWAAQWWNSFISRDKAVKLVPDKKDSRELFWNGNVPFNMDGPWFIGLTQDRDAALLDDIGVIPQFNIEYNGASYKPNPSNYPVLTCISKKCKNPDAAWDFLAWMTSDEAQKIIEQCGQIPSSIEYSNSAEYKDSHTLAYNFVDFIQNYYATLVSDPAIPQYGEINQVMIDTAQIIFGETPMNVKPELDKAQAAIEAIMKQ
jgi:ABC-type glycerol-3-phosphate transport system substrate-binding protein